MGVNDRKSHNSSPCSNKGFSYKDFRVYKNGYTCHNHICLISYLKENINDFDYEIQKIDELRMIRNEINYRGLSIKKEYMLRNELEFKNIITKLKEFASIIM